MICLVPQRRRFILIQGQMSKLKATLEITLLSEHDC